MRDGGAPAPVSPHGDPGTPPHPPTAMRRAALLLALPLLLAAPDALRAQREGARWVPYAGVSAGGATLPDVFQGCSLGTNLAADARLGVARGALALEARAVALAEPGMVECALVDPFVPQDGIHTLTRYPFHGRDGHLAGDLRLRVGGTRALPLVLSAGAGWLSPTDVPYLLAAAGVRLGGRVRLALDAERTWYRATATDWTAEWKDGTPVRTLSEVERVEWLRGSGVRVGLELPFR